MIIVILFCAFVLFLAGCTNQPTNVPNAPNNAPATGNGISFNTTVSIGATQTIPAATSGNPYNAKITPFGGSPPYGCTAAPGTSMPGSLVFSEPGCSITGEAPTLAPGTPTASYPFSFVIIDSNGKSGGPFSLQLVVNQAPYALNLPATLPTATIGTTYGFNFCGTSNGGIDCAKLGTPYSFTASGQPLGLTMRPDGILIGTVPQGANEGIYPIHVCVTDSSRTETCADTNLPVVKQKCPLADYAGTGWTATFNYLVSETGTGNELGPMDGSHNSGTFTFTFVNESSVQPCQNLLTLTSGKITGITDPAYQPMTLDKDRGSSWFDGHSFLINFGSEGAQNGIIFSAMASDGGTSITTTQINGRVDALLHDSSTGDTVNGVGTFTATRIN
ncbi:MAG: putative Ig domain-containing protein [Candidatus Micrarchaeota archaeon]|nr:putative Ig domain-containing protein [Candidatus Micrarchaeota archaeon]